MGGDVAGSSTPPGWVQGQRQQITDDKKWMKKEVCSPKYSNTWGYHPRTETEQKSAHGWRGIFCAIFCAALDFLGFCQIKLQLETRSLYLFTAVISTGVTNVHRKSCFYKHKYFPASDPYTDEESAEWKRRLVCTGTTIMANEWLRKSVKIRIIFCVKWHS